MEREPVVRIDYGNGVVRWFSAQQLARLAVRQPEIMAVIRETTREWAESMPGQTKAE